MGKSLEDKKDIKGILKDFWDALNIAAFYYPTYSIEHRIKTIKMILRSIRLQKIMDKI